MGNSSTKEVKGMHAFVPIRPARTPLYCLVWALQLLAAPVLFPFRLLVILFSFVLISLSMRILTYKLDVSKPINPFRRSIIRLQTMLVTSLFVWSTGCRIVEKDTQNKPDAELDHVLIYNHTSSLDGAVMAALGFTSHICKHNVRKMPVFGITEYANQAIFVNRGSANSKEQGRAAIAERTALATAPHGLPREWPMLSGAPEGTTTNGTAVINFKPGLFGPGKPVHACHIAYDTTLLGCSDAHQHMVILILKMMLCFRTRCTIRYLPKYTPTPAESSDPTLYATNVRYYFHTQTGLPLLDMTGADKQYYRHNHDDISLCSHIVRENYPQCRSGSGHYVLVK